MEKNDLDFLNKQYDCGFVEIGIAASRQSVSNNSEVLKTIKDFSPSDGWISWQSSPAERYTGDFDAKGEHIIAGEFYNTNGTSLSVRFDGECWNVYTYRASEEGAPMMRRSVKQLSKINNNTYVSYDVYYRFDSKLGYRPYCSAFTGFTEVKND